jgi:hypothetical protein
MDLPFSRQISIRHITTFFPFLFLSTQNATAPLPHHNHEHLSLSLADHHPQVTTMSQVFIFILF